MDFMVNMFDGGSGISLTRLLMGPVVRGLEFKILSISVTSIRSDSLSSDSPYVLRSDKRTA